MNKERITPDEIFGEMHKSGLEHLAHVNWAILETDGKISIVPEDANGEVKGSRPDDKGPI